MASVVSSSPLDICRLSPEILTLILSKLSAKSVLNVSETCRHLRDVVFGCDVLWKRLCMNNFKFDLQVKGPFKSFASIYELIYKYKAIVANREYGSYVPEYYLHWGVLLEEGSTGYNVFESGLWRCTNSRLKKAWEIPRAPLHARGPRKDVTITCIKSQLEVDNRQQFQEAVLQRCIRNQKKICQHFETASMLGRCESLRRYISDNHTLKDILLTSTTVEECGYEELRKGLLTHMPNVVGMDFIEGHFHKTGIEQVKNYVQFVKDTREFYKSKQSLSKIVDAFFVPVYKKLRQTAKLRLITFNEYVDVAEEYFSRIEEMENWKKETEYHLSRRIIFVFEGIHEKEAYRNYVLHGRQEDFTALKNHYEGLINIKMWLRSNMSIESLLGSTIVNVLKGQPLGNILEMITKYKEIEDCMKKYLETSKTKHFRKLIRKLWRYAFEEHEQKAEYLERLQNNLIGKNVFPPYVKPPSQEKSADADDQ